LVTLPEYLVSLVSSAHKELETYFKTTELNKKLENSEYFGTPPPENLGLPKPTDGPVYGYYLSEGHKEGLRLLTGNRMKNLWKPKSLVHLDGLAKELHNLIINILNVSSKTVFEMSPEELAQKDVPILSKNASEGFGLLDIAYYTHEKFANQSAVSESVAPHFDPGILSINVLSSEQGLQFQDAAGNWVDLPFNGDFVGVIWAGELAKVISNGKIKPGVHRVRAFPGKLTRTSIWIEACTKLQDISTSMKILESIVVDKKKKFHFGADPDVKK